MSVDLSGIEGQILYLLGLVVIGLLAATAKRIYSYLGLKADDAAVAKMEDAAGKSLTAGIVKAQDVIKAKGWDHVSVKQAVVAAGIQYAVAKFPDALKGVGIDISDPAEVVAKVGDILTRKFPEVAAQAAASPVTPPVAAAA